MKGKTRRIGFSPGAGAYLMALNLLDFGCVRLEPLPDQEGESGDEDKDEDDGSEGAEDVGSEEGDDDEESDDSGGDDGAGSDESGPDEGSGSADTGTDDGEDFGDSGSSDAGTDDTGTGDSGTDDTGTGDSGTDDVGTGDTASDDTGTDGGDNDDTGSDDPETDDSGGGGSGECMTDDECSARTPYCEAGSCVGCDGLMTTCADRDPAMPVCRDTGGVCVECTAEQDDLCEERGWVCGESNICRPCNEHRDCAVACDLPRGQCMDAEPVYVDNTSCSSGVENGTQEEPFCTIGDALETIGDGGTGIIMVQGGGAPYLEFISVNVGRTAVVIGAGMPVIEESARYLVVVEESRLMLSGFVIDGSSAAINTLCTNATLWMDDSELLGTADGINAQGCDVHVRRTSVLRSAGSGLLASGGSMFLEDVTISGAGGNGVNISEETLTIKTATIAGNTGSAIAASEAIIEATRVQALANDAGGIHLTNNSELSMDTSIIGRNGIGLEATRGLEVSSSSADLNYVTIAGNQGNDGGRSIDCSEGSPITIRNSIIVAEMEQESVACETLVVTTSAVQDMDILEGNQDVGTWDPTWFRDVAGNDFHLGSTRDIFEAAAVWQTGDPFADIDEDARPSTSDAADWPGADVPD